MEEVKSVGLQDTPVVGTLSASDPEGRPLTLSLGCTPKQGIVQLGEPTSDGQVPFTYFPDDKSFGLDSFLFIASNGQSLNAGLVRSFCPSAQLMPKIKPLAFLKMS